MNFKNSLERGVFVSFVPKHLEIADNQGLSAFPLNVLFAQYKIENGKTIMGSAVYNPDFESFTLRGGVYSLRYLNAYGGKSWLVIECDEKRNSYIGKKVVNDEFAGAANGIEWNLFFTHFTALGLANGERCEFREIN